MELRPYQVEGVNWLASRRFGVLGDEMGLGKTFQATSAARKAGVVDAISISPASVRRQWEKAWPASGVLRFAAFGYEEAIKKLPQILSDPPELVVFDEYHYLKNPEAKRTLHLLQLAHHVKHMWGLSGTPMPNHPGELWAWLYVTGATKMSYARWCHEFCVFDDMGRVRGGKNLARLRQALKKFLLRRTMEEVGMQLPPLTVTHLQVDKYHPDHGDLEIWFQRLILTLQGEEKDVLAQVAKEEEFLRECIDANNFDEIEANIPALTTVRRWYACLKTPTVANMIVEELKARLYNKIIVFAVHRQAIMGMRDMMKKAGVGALVLYGGSKNRDKIIDDFVTKQKYQVLVTNISTGGTGVDGFQKVCNNCIFLESEWTPAKNRQALSRLYRSGQEKPVNCRVINVGGFDELMNKTLLRKEKLTEEVGL